MKFTSITRLNVSLPASTLLAFALVATLSITALPAFAEPDLLDGDMGFPSSSPNNSMIDSGSINSEPQTPKITPAQAADLVRRATGGQVMGVNSQHTEQGVIYGVKVLNSGRMKIIRVDGQTGQIIN